MSLLPKNELHMLVSESAVKVDHVVGWRTPRVVATESAAGGGASAVTTALVLLAKGGRLPRKARLIVADQSAYYRIVTHRGPSSAVLADATQQFERTLGTADLSVSVTLMPSGTRWLAAALPGAWINACVRAATDQGVKVASVTTELCVELDRVRPAVGNPASLLVLLRERGSMLVRLHQGSPAAIGWERMGSDSLDNYLARIDAFGQRSAMDLGDTDHPSTPPVVVFSPTAEASPLLTRCRQRGWTVLSLRPTLAAAGALA